MENKTRTYRTVLTDENELPFIKMKKNKNNLINVKFDIMLKDTQFKFDIDCSVYKNKFTCNLMNKEMIGDECPDRFSFFIYSKLYDDDYVIKIARSNDIEYENCIIGIEVDNEYTDYDWMLHYEPVEREINDYVRVVPFTNKL